MPSAETRARAATTWLHEVAEQVAAVTEKRNTAIVELREAGWSYEQIAEAIGISKDRVAQLARAAGHGGRANSRS